MMVVVGVDACIDPRADASIRPYSCVVGLSLLHPLVITHKQKLLAAA